MIITPVALKPESFFMPWDKVENTLKKAPSKVFIVIEFEPKV